MCVRLGVLLLIGVLLLGIAAACDNATRVLRIQIPQELDPAKAVVEVGQFGESEGGSYGPASRKGDSHEFTASVGQNMKQIKVFVYYPGYNIVTAEMDRAQLASLSPFSPKLEKLASAPLTIKLTRSDGKPIAGHSVSIGQPLLAMEFLSPSDWLSGPPPTFASGVTDSSGSLSVDVPSLLDDPAFVKFKAKPEFFLVAGNGEFTGQAPVFDFVPKSIPAQRSYPEPVVVKLIHRGRISGKLRQSFLDRNGFDAAHEQPSEILFYAWDIARKTGRGSPIEVGRPFSVQLPPGTYHLSLEVYSRETHIRKAIPMEKDFLLDESQDRQVVLK